VHLLNMPERDSKRIHHNHAKQLAKHLGVPLVVKYISPILRVTGTYRMLPLRFIPGRYLRSALVNFAKSHLDIDRDNLLAHRLDPGARTWVAKGGAYAVTKHRIRMVMVYRYAEVNNLMVVGAANRSEWLTGTFSKWGVDHCADVMPLLHVYRSQLEQLAEYLGVPEVIRNKAADPDVMPGVNDKGALLGDFNTADQILCAIEQGVDQDELRKIYGDNNVNQILTLWKLSRHMRESPYHLPAI
jgi:NAD+ synthase